MNFRHTNKTLQRTDDESDFNGRFSVALAKAFRHLMHFIRLADNENELRARKANRFEKLKGDRQHEYSMRLTARFRLTFKIEKAEDGDRLIILDIEDYH
jgi:toxin HigB-1